MLLSERYGYFMPFPKILDCTKAKYAVSSLALRPFGLFARDLEIDFSQKRRPFLVTQILQCCTRNKDGDIPNENFFWDLTVGKRIECLLSIAALGCSSEFSIYLGCLNQACQEPMEIEISLEEIANLQRQGDETDPFMIQMGGERLHIRRPTGNDQRKWLKTSFPDEDAAIKAVIRTLLQDNEKASYKQEIKISEEWVKTINETMGEFDPLVNFSLTVYCPHCGKEGHYRLNFEELSLRQLHQAQLRLLQTIHRLAAHYHWSEQQILSLPPWRRSHYLALIEREETR